MQFKTFYFTVLLLIQLFISCTAWAYDWNKNKFQVYLNLSSPDNIIVDEIRSNINSEFRRLGDVILVDNEKTCDWILEIIAMDVMNKQGTSTGIVAYSVTVYQPFDNKQLITLTKKELKPTTPLGKTLGFDPDDTNQALGITDPVKYVQSITENLYHITDHHLLVDSNTKIPEAIRSIISRFDVKHVEPMREANRMIMDGMKKLLKKTP